MALNAGALIHRVTIQRLTDGVDTSGAPTETPARLCDAWMARETVSGMEKFASNQLSASSVLRWTMRYQPNMDPDLIDVPKSRRLLYQHRAYDITEAQTLDRKAGIVLTTLAGSGVAA